MKHNWDVIHFLNDILKPRPLKNAEMFNHAFDVFNITAVVKPRLAHTEVFFPAFFQLRSKLFHNFNIAYGPIIHFTVQDNAARCTNANKDIVFDMMLVK